MTKYASGEEAKVGDVIKFVLGDENHFGKVEKLEKTGEADVDQVRHDPGAVQHHINVAEAILVHRNDAETEKK